MRTHVHALGGALWSAALMTFGDWVWARFITSHRTVFGLAHGLLLCLAIGLYLGLLRGRAVKGALVGAAIGLGAAAGFYLLALLIGYAAMFVMWMALWVGFGMLVGRGLGEPRQPPSSAWFRGGMAAIGSGLAFYAISDIWRPHPGGPNYAYNFLCWTLAFLPGFAALLVRRSSESGA
jgi:hypothetical protein